SSATCRRTSSPRTSRGSRRSSTPAGRAPPFLPARKAGRMHGMSKGLKPTLITLMLSAAAALGYVTYRVAFDDREPAADVAHDGGHEHGADRAAALPDALPEF